MIELVLKSLLLFLLAGIVLTLCYIAYLIFRDYLLPQCRIKSSRKSHRESMPDNIVTRAENSIMRVNNGEIKMEGLGNEADPHEEWNSVANYRETLAKSKFFGMIKDIKELGYYE